MSLPMLSREFRHLRCSGHKSIATSEMPVSMSEASRAAALRVLGRGPLQRVLRAPLTGTEMVDFDLATPEGSPKNGTGSNGSPSFEARPGDRNGPSTPENPLSLESRVRAAALSLPAFQKHPGIMLEFDRSLQKRTRIWRPVMEAVLGDHESLSQPALCVLAAWFTMVHLSAPIDQWMDGDLMSSGWQKLGKLGGFELVLTLKDQALSLPVAQMCLLNCDVDRNRIAQAAVNLASESLTAAIGSYPDIAGSLSIGPASDLEALGELYARLVNWKSASIYRCLMSCLAAIRGSEAAETRALAEFGHSLGIAIQAFDDAGGIWGGGDDLEKSPPKVTFAIAYGLLNGHPRSREFRQLLIGPAGETRIDGLRSLLDEMDALGFIEFLIEACYDDCARAVDSLPPRLSQTLLQWYEGYFRRDG